MGNPPEAIPSDRLPQPEKSGCDHCQDTEGPYTELVMDHFLNPRNIGSLENPDGMGTCGDPSCGDCLVMHLQIHESRIETVRYLVLGCAAAIASSSMTSILATGRTLEEASQISDQDIEQALGGLPAAKRHCSLLGATALRNAIADYRQQASTP